MVMEIHSFKKLLLFVRSRVGGGGGGGGGGSLFVVLYGTPSSAILGRT